MSTNVVFKMDPFCCPGICCALFAHLFIRNPYQLRFWSWCYRCIVPIWFGCPQVSWSARPTLIPRGGRSIPTAGIFLFFWWPEINPWSHTLGSRIIHGCLAHMRGYFLKIETYFISRVFSFLLLRVVQKFQKYSSKISSWRLRSCLSVFSRCSDNFPT